MEAKVCPESVKPLNKILRSEMAAQKVYSTAIDELHDHLEEIQLKKISDEHALAIRMLIEHVKECGGEPEESSDLWGHWADTLKHLKSSKNERESIDTLIRSEQHGVQVCEEVLEDSELDLSSANLVRTELIPRLRTHVEILESLLKK